MLPEGNHHNSFQLNRITIFFVPGGAAIAIMPAPQPRPIVDRRMQNFDSANGTFGVNDSQQCHPALDVVARGKMFFGRT